jgi:thiol-disulfide isomerase/thioredoxin
MRYQKACIWWVRILIAAVLFIPGPGGAEHLNKVQKIDIEGLDQVVRGRGRYLLVFMAAWCTPCIKELPDVNALYEKYRDRGLKMIGVSVDFEGPLAMQPIVNRVKINFPVYWVGEAAIEAYNIRGIPFIIFIRNGEIVERLLGQRSKNFLDKKFEAFLALP